MPEQIADDVIRSARARHCFLGVVGSDEAFGQRRVHLGKSPAAEGAAWMEELERWK